ncbi:MAG TPA: SIMPL domain-containing protein [Terriglobia bacterium]|nr:SIMPL domain-containing protein [Terriglobia bacterium]
MKRIALATLLAAATATHASAQRADSPPPVLMVNGNAQIMAAPDQATVRLGIVRQATAAQVAQEQANAIGQEILNSITRLGVPAPQIQTSRLVLNPVYAPRSPETRDAPRIVAYTASNIVSVRLDNLSLIGPVIDAGLKAGANQLEGVQFGLRNDLPAREQALKQAVAEARSKAQVMADALRVALIEVIEVSEGGVSFVPPQPYALGRVMAAQAADTATPVSPGEIEVHASVTVRYRIAPKP